MEKIENVFIIEYHELRGSNYAKALDKEDYDPMNYEEVKNDTIHNAHPFEIKPFDFTNLLEAQIACAFSNWLADLEDGKLLFEDYLDELGFDFKDYMDYNNIIEMLMRWMCTVSEIPEGNYFIRVSW